MKILDLHCDIGTDCYEEIKKGNLEPFKTRHYDKLIAGEVNYVCCACFFSGNENWETMKEMIEIMNKELESNDLVFIKEHQDFDKDGKIHGIISVEGMGGITENPRECIRWMRAHNVLIASLAWNDQNYLATGVKGSVTRGLSDAGWEAIDEMAKLRMILDVSHLNEASFWDVIKNYKGRICATHSNARTLCPHDRNLTDQQLRALASRGAIIGMNAYSLFISEDPTKQGVLDLALHAKYIANLIGIEHVACGFDFMDFCSGYGPAGMAKGLESDTVAQNFIKALSEVGFSNEQIEMIAYKNALNLLKN